MKLTQIMDRYLLDQEYKITIYKNKVHIMNYLEIDNFSNTEVVIKHQGGKTIITGFDLVVSKMEADEVLITGKIENIRV